MIRAAKLPVPKIRISAVSFICSNLASDLPFSELGADDPAQQAQYDSCQRRTPTKRQGGHI
jgi:hypothetical protein